MTITVHKYNVTMSRRRNLPSRRHSRAWNCYHAGLLYLKMYFMTSPSKLLLEIFAENLTKWPMVNTFAENNGGYIYSNPPLVQPGKREAFVTHDNGAVATGTYGKWKYFVIYTYWRFWMYSLTPLLPQMTKKYSHEMATGHNGLPHIHTPSKINGYKPSVNYI